jgi:hypothetical protein
MAKRKATALPEAASIWHGVPTTLQPNHRLNAGELEKLITLICTVPGNAPGSNPPYPDSPMGLIVRKLQLQLDLLK